MKNQLNLKIVFAKLFLLSILTGVSNSYAVLAIKNIFNGEDFLIGISFAAIALGAILGAH